MPERSVVPGIALLALSGLLTAACWFNSPWAGLAALCAQAPAALAIGALRGELRRAQLLPDVGRLTLLWGGCAAVGAVLLAWPLVILLAAPSLGRSLLASGLAGLLLVLLWRQWQALATLHRSGGSLTSQFAAQRESERPAWRGLLQVAVPVFVVLLGALLLTWPGLLTGTARVVGLVVYLLVVPSVHLLIQRAVPSAQRLPVVDMPRTATTTHVANTPAAFSDPVGASAVLDPAALTRDLYTAARDGRIERALALLEAGADPHALPEPDVRDRRSLAVLAAVLPDLRLLRALIQRGTNINAMHGGMTPLLAATRDSWHGRPEAVMTLLTNGGDSRLTDADGNTPLHPAARSTDPGVAALLRDAGALLDALNHEGASPLGVACSAGNWRLARFLLERGAQTEPDGGRPALLLAASAEDDDPVGVQLLLRHKAKVNARDGLQRTALHMAAAAGHCEICTALLAAGAEANATDANGRTPIHDAASAGAVPVLDVVLKAGADAQLTDAHGATALHLACAAETPSLDMVQRLVALGLNPTAIDADGLSALAIATKDRHWRLVAALDPRQPLPVSMLEDDTLSQSRPPLLLLREQLVQNASAALLDAFAAPLGQSDFDSLLRDSEVCAEPARVVWLLQRGANPEATVPGAVMPVQAALAQGVAGWPQLSRLLAAGAAPAGAGGLARFLAASRSDASGNDTSAGERYALELLARGADPFGTTPEGEAPLLLATQLGWRALLIALLALGVDPDTSDHHGTCALHVAVKLGHTDSVRQLILHGAAPDRRAADGQTPLGIALAMGNTALASWLDWRFWRLPHRPLRDSDLPAAAVAGDLDSVRRLIDLGLPVNATDSQGCTALLRAAGGGHLALVERLLDQAADPSLAAHTGATPLSAAISKARLDIVDRLLVAGSALNQRLPGEVTVLMLAAALGLPKLVARLLQAGADLHDVDAHGLTALHCAALFGFTARDRTRLVALLDTLLLAGANPQQPTAGGLTPLLFLLGARADAGTPCAEDVLLEALEHLLDEDVRLDVHDGHGRGPLHLAALHGLQHIAQRLLAAGADPDRRDQHGRTPAEVASQRGFLEIAAILAPTPNGTPDNVSLARFLREP